MTLTRRQTLIGAAATVAAAALPASKLKLVEGISGEAVIGPASDAVAFELGSGEVFTLSQFQEFCHAVDMGVVMDGEVKIKIYGQEYRIYETQKPDTNLRIPAGLRIE